LSSKKKLIVIGLDCATSKTLFEDFKDECPNIRNLMNKGVYGNLRSSDPPITVPAWMVMATGKKAGTLGIYGFRHRKEKSYSDFWVVNSQSIKEPKIWDILRENGYKSIILGVPPTFPPQKMNGNLISGFITPDSFSNFTFPPELKEEISKIIDNYVFDVQFRTSNKEQLLIDIYKMTRIHFKALKYLLKNKDWDFCQFVIIGLDRFHHAFWKYYDKSHHKFEPGNLFETAMKNFYKFLDKEIGEVLELVNSNTIVFLVSDHGAKAMKGSLCINIALEKLGLLKFLGDHLPGTKLGDAKIDWNNTYAWGWGGHYARIFLNVKDREKSGIIDSKDYEKWQGKIAELIKSIPDDKGNPMNTKVLKPQDLFETVRGDVPDLLVYFDDLKWRSAGTVGHKSMYLDENETGPDDAVHDYNGVFIIYDPSKEKGEKLDEKNILDIAPTILKIFGIKIPEDLEGKSIEY